MCYTRGKPVTDLNCPTMAQLGNQRAIGSHPNWPETAREEPHKLGLAGSRRHCTSGADQVCGRQKADHNSSSKPELLYKK